MEITLILKTAGIGILVSTAYIILSRSGREEMAMFVSLAGIILVLLMIIDEISELFSAIRNVFGV
ncbi:MAG: stage III sporulation protein AC [Clostridia bacterium]|nr:stage III sporulation protein AC [Clostridia bacterium]